LPSIQIPRQVLLQKLQQAVAAPPPRQQQQQKLQISHPPTATSTPQPQSLSNSPIQNKKLLSPQLQVEEMLAEDETEIIITNAREKLRRDYDGSTSKRRNLLERSNDELLLNSRSRSRSLSTDSTQYYYSNTDTTSSSAFDVLESRKKMIQLIRNTERKRKQLEEDIFRIEQEYQVITQADEMLERTKCYEDAEQEYQYNEEEKKVRLQVSLSSLIIFQICTRKKSEKFAVEISEAERRLL
jgi:hypothetical protein